MKNCKECTHCHDFGHKIMCDLGIGEIIVIGHVIATMTIDECYAYHDREDVKKVLEEVADAMSASPKKLGRPPKNA